MQQSVIKSDIQFHINGLYIQVGQLSYGTITHPIPLHSHGASCYELHYIKDGYGTLYVNGENYSIAPNTLYTTGPNLEHAQYSYQPHPMIEYCLYLIVQDHGTTPIIRKFLDTIFWCGEDKEDVLVTMEQIITEFSMQKIGYKEQLQYLISQLIIQMIRCYEQKESSNKRLKEENTIDRISVAIEHYFLYEYKELTLDGLANRLNLSPRQTQRILKNNYNKTFQEKKAEAKMAVASLLLDDMNNPILFISEELGYSSPEHFSMAFRKYYGFSPREYRKRLKKD